MPRGNVKFFLVHFRNDGNFSVVKSAGIILAGVGFEDGTSVWDVAYLLRELERQSVKPVPLVPRQSVEKTIPGSRRKRAPDRDFAAEAKLMVRGAVYFLDQFDLKSLDMVVIPGGKGAIRVLTSVEIDGTEARILPEVKECVMSAFARKKPIVTIGYGGMVAAVALRAVANLILTVGDDAQMIELIKQFGGDALRVQAYEAIRDDENNVFSTPGTNPKASLYRASLGIERVIQEVAQT